MKYKIILNLLVILLFNNSFSQHCIEKKEFRTKEVYYTFDNKKALFPFDIDVKTDSNTVILKVYSKEGTKELIFYITKIVLCNNINKKNYTAKVIAVISKPENEDFDNDNNTSVVKQKTNITISKINGVYKMVLISPEFDNNELEINLKEIKK